MCVMIVSSNASDTTRLLNTGGILYIYVNWWCYNANADDVVIRMR